MTHTVESDPLRPLSSAAVLALRGVFRDLVEIASSAQSPLLFADVQARIAGAGLAPADEAVAQAAAPWIFDIAREVAALRRTVEAALRAPDHAP